MAGLDRLGWAAGTAFSVHGIRFGVRVNRPELLERVEACLPPGRKRTRSAVVDGLFSLVGAGPEPGGTRKLNLLYWGTVRRLRSPDLERALELLEADLRMAVATYARRAVFLHAGVVGWRGRALLIPGRSRAGKSTLVAELVRAGADYYSDEFAVVDERGCVHPFAKPLSIRREGAAGERIERVPAAELGGRAGRRPLRPGLVVLASYRQGARWRPRTLTPGRGALALLRHTVPARLRPAESLAAVERLSREAPVLQGRRGEARDVARALLEQLERTVDAP